MLSLDIRNNPTNRKKLWRIKHLQQCSSHKKIKDTDSKNSDSILLQYSLTSRHHDNNIHIDKHQGIDKVSDLIDLDKQEVKASNFNTELVEEMPERHQQSRIKLESLELVQKKRDQF